METAETIRAKVAKILGVATENIQFTDAELQDLPALQNPHTLQTILTAFQYGKDAGRLEDMCYKLRNKEERSVFALGGALKLLMHNLQIDPKGGAR